jgi:hypothetical protein
MTIVLYRCIKFVALFVSYTFFSPMSNQIILKHNKIWEHALYEDINDTDAASNSTIKSETHWYIKLFSKILIKIKHNVIPI